jgi:hypothetical protein
MSFDTGCSQCLANKLHVEQHQAAVAEARELVNNIAGEKAYILNKNVGLAELNEELLGTNSKLSAKLTELGNTTVHMSDSSMLVEKQKLLLTISTLQSEILNKQAEIAQKDVLLQEASDLRLIRDVIIVLKDAMWADLIQHSPDTIERNIHEFLRNAEGDTTKMSALRQCLARLSIDEAEFTLLMEASAIRNRSFHLAGRTPAALADSIPIITSQKYQAVAVILAKHAGIIRAAKEST